MEQVVVCRRRQKQRNTLKRVGRKERVDFFLRGFSDSMKKGGEGLLVLSMYDYNMLYIPLVHIVLFYLHFDAR